MEMKISPFLADSSANKTGHVSNGIGVKKKERKKNQFLHCGLCHRDGDCHTNTLTHTVSQYLGTSQCVPVSG